MLIGSWSRAGQVNVNGVTSAAPAGAEFDLRWRRNRGRGGSPILAAPPGTGSARTWWPGPDGIRVRAGVRVTPTAAASWLRRSYARARLMAIWRLLGRCNSTSEESG